MIKSFLVKLFVFVQLFNCFKTKMTDGFVDVGLNVVSGFLELMSYPVV